MRVGVRRPLEVEYESWTSSIYVTLRLGQGLLHIEKSGETQQSGQT